MIVCKEKWTKLKKSVQMQIVVVFFSCSDICQQKPNHIRIVDPEYCGFS